MFDKYENFLTEYFLFGSMLGNLNDKKVFDVLSDVCCVDDKELDRLYALSQSENVLEVKTYDDYKRYLRINQYLGVVDDGEEYQMVAIKGQALAYSSKFELCAVEGMTPLSVKKNLMANAACGKIAAMRCVGILQFVGHVFDKNQANGLDLIKKAADWGDVNAALALLRFRENDRIDAHAILNAAVQNTPYEYLIDIVREKYGVKTSALNENVLLVKDAFSQQIARPDEFSSSFERVMQSGLLSLSDKYKVLLSDNKALVAAACDLPLKLRFSRMNYKGVKSVFDREDEKDKIDVVLRNNELRGRSSYRPLCIVCDDKYVSSLYARAVKNAFQGCHTEAIYARELTEYDLTDSSDNAFISSIDEDTSNVLIFIARGDVSSAVNAKIAEFAQNSIRRKFRLRNPAVAIDLSAVYPVVICDRENAEFFAPYTDQVKVRELSERELPFAVKDLFNAKCKKALVSNSSVSDDVVEKLVSMGIDKAESILDAAIKELRVGDVNLTMGNMSKFFTETNASKKRYGFGGKIDEN